MKRKIRKYVSVTLITIAILIFLLLFVFSPLESIKDVNYTAEISISDVNDQEIMHLINNHRTTPVDLTKLNSKNLEILLDIEDKDFYKHSGFNLKRIFKTVASNFKNNQSYGASTITQQYIKNVYLNNEKSFSRKIKELYYAIKLEQVATKDEILTGYLNCIYFGNDIYGISNAANYYFNKSYADLNVEEMVTLVALLNAPTYYSSNLNALEKKKNALAKTLYNHNVIDKDEYEKTLKPLNFNYNKQIYSSNLLYFIDYLLKEYQTLNINPKFNQKVKISTHYQPKLNQFKVHTEANYAAIAVDKEGYVVSMIGDSDYYKSAYNIATNGKRDIGSTIKPLLYYEAIKCGFSPNTTYYSAPFSFDYHDSKVTVNNYASIYPYRQINMKEALATSDNIYAIKTHQAIGFKTLVNHFKKYEIEAKMLPSLALGSIGMSLYKLVQIYTQFFTEGIYLKPHCILSIEVDSKPAYTHKPKFLSLGDKTIFKQVKDLMAGTFDPTIPRATAASLANRLNTKCYGKSGLTDYDSYMIGFSNEVLIGIWSGYLDNRELTDPTVKKLPKDIFVNLMNNYK